MSSFPVACLLLACLVSSRFHICLVPPLYSPVGTAWRCASALFAITAGVRMSCRCRATAAACSSVRLRLVCLSPRSIDTGGGEGSMASSLLASFGFLPSAALVSVLDGVGCLLVPMPSVVSVLRCAMCGFCGSRSLRLPGRLRHGILSLCRRGRMSTVAAHRNSLACFSIPISAPIFASSPVFDAYSGLGHFQSFHARCSWDRSFRRASPRPLYPWRTGRGVFMPIISVVSWLKRRGRMR